MAKRIISLIEPFGTSQETYVYEDGNKIEALYPSISEIPDVIMNLAKKYDIEDVSLIGSKQFNRGIVKQIQTKELEDYGTNKLKILTL